MTIHIYYRHYNIEKTDGRNRPIWFDYEKCFLNLLDSLEDQFNIPLTDVKLNVVYDGEVGNNWIEKLDSQDRFQKYYIKAGNDFKSFQQTCELIKNNPLIQENDLIYFLENDYLHTLDWVSKTKELFTTYSNLNYVSLYDHNDKYHLPMYDDLVSKVFTTSTHHWRSTPSTCGSFIIRKEIFEQDYDILSTMEGDHNKFLWLNKKRNRFVITPIPGLSTHCMEGLLSPTINWEEL